MTEETKNVTTKDERISIFSGGYEASVFSAPTNQLPIPNREIRLGPSHSQIA